MHKPLIGITMSLDASDMIVPGASFGFVRRDYGAQIKAAGGEPIFIEPSSDPLAMARLCDGIVITGGQDIDPAVYGQTQRTDAAVEPIERTHWERELIDACDDAGVSILGICYGSQLLNVHYGGSLYQDLSEHGETLNHGTTGQAALQDIRFSRDFLGFSAGSSSQSAHRHHQAVATLGDGFEVVASSSDGITEAIAGRGHFGVQWHAEADGTAVTIYGAFIRHCQQHVAHAVLGGAELLPEPA